MIGWLLGCTAATIPPTETARSSVPDPLDLVFDAAASNVLLLILDDFGRDQIAALQVHPDPPATPALDDLVSRGLSFDNAYVSPVCSPSRAAVLTGRLPHHTGIGDLVVPWGADEVAESEVFLPERLAEAGVATAALGKWHLSGVGAVDAATHPQRQGFDTHRGTFANLVDSVVPRDEALGYQRWERLVDGEAVLVNGYATAVLVDDTLAWIEETPSPWFASVAFHAPHGPYHVPPGSDLAPDAPVVDRHAAMVTALDAEIARLLAAMDPSVLTRTLVLILGDNGTASAGVRPPWDPDRAKGTLYEGGIHVPLIAFGAGVTPGATDTLVHGVDLFSTVAEVAGVDPGDVDGQSLVPWLTDPTTTGGRQFVVVERFGPNGFGAPARQELAIRDATHKYLEVRSAGDVSWELFDLRGRVDDGPDLSDEADATSQDALSRLRAALAVHEES